MTENVTQIREAENRVKIEGVVKEIRLEEKDDVISGDVVIQTDEKSEHVVSVYVNKHTKSGGENKAFKGMETVMNDYVSVAGLMKSGKTHDEAISEATCVRINNGKLDRQEFYTPSGEFVSNARISSNFISRITDDCFEPKAEFEVECYIDKIRKEIKDNEETGRIIIDTIMPLYGGKVVPQQFVAADEVAEYIEDNYAAKQTAMFWGDVINIAERNVIKKSGFGKDKEDVRVNYKRELIITGGGNEPYDDEDPKAYTTKQIQEAWKVRETETLPEMLKKSQNKGKQGVNKSTKNTAPQFNF